MAAGTASLGAALGRAYVPGYGLGLVFDTGSKDFFAFQNNAGHRYHVARAKIQWRKSPN